MTEHLKIATECKQKVKLRLTIRIYDAFSTGTGENAVRLTEQTQIVECDIPYGAKVGNRAFVEVCDHV